MEGDIVITFFLCPGGCKCCLVVIPPGCSVELGLLTEGQYVNGSVVATISYTDSCCCCGCCFFSRFSCGLPVSSACWNEQGSFKDDTDGSKDVGMVEKIEGLESFLNLVFGSVVEVLEFPLGFGEEPNKLIDSVLFLSDHADDVCCSSADEMCSQGYYFRVFSLDTHTLSVASESALQGFDDVLVYSYVLSRRFVRSTVVRVKRDSKEKTLVGKKEESF